MWKASVCSLIFSREKRDGKMNGKVHDMKTRPIDG